MALPMIAALVIAVLVLGYRFYGRWVARQFVLEPLQPVLQRAARVGEPLALGAPHLRVDPATDDLASLRGASDGLALRLQHSDAALHDVLSPTDTVARFVFELLEQYRCESLAAWPGLRQNLWQRHQAWTDAFLRSRLTESVSGLLLFTIAQSVRLRLTGARTFS